MSLETKSNRKRYIAPLAILVAIGAAAVVPSTGAFSSFTSESINIANSVASAEAKIQFVDPDTGLEVSLPRMNVVGALPGMSPLIGAFNLKNTGSGTVDVTLSSRNVRGLLNNLDDVLIATVKDATGTALYTGKVSEMTSVSFGTIAPAAAKSFTIEITWPATTAPNDATYQGRVLTFDVAAIAVSVAG